MFANGSWRLLFSFGVRGIKFDGTTSKSYHTNVLTSTSSSFHARYLFATRIHPQSTRITLQIWHHSLNTSPLFTIHLQSLNSRPSLPHLSRTVRLGNRSSLGDGYWTYCTTRNTSNHQARCICNSTWSDCRNGR